nr:DUF3572 domain-containing protein [Novosphingobium sp. MBES04]
MLPRSPSPAKADAPDPQALSLNALGWVLADGERAQRFLALTGLTPDDLRASLGDPATLAGVLEFLCAYEPDLVAAAEALGVEPQVIAEARERMAR